MKTLKQYIIESFTKISTSWMIEHYKKYNKEYFNNELLDPEYVDIQYTTDSFETGTELGHQGFHVDVYLDKTQKLVNGMYQIFDENGYGVTDWSSLKPFIYINNSIGMTELMFEDTLIHEMIHLWVTRNCTYPKYAHGKEFKAKCKEVRDLAYKKYGKQYELSTHALDFSKINKDDLVENVLKRNKKNVVGIFTIFDKSKMKKPEYNMIFTFCPKHILNKFVNEIKTEYGYLGPKIYVTENTYEKMCRKFGLFQTYIKELQYFILSDFGDNEDDRKYIYDIMTDTNEILESYWNEKPISKEQIEKTDLKNIMYCIPSDTDLINFDVNDAIPIYKGSYEKIS